MFNNRFNLNFNPARAPVHQEQEQNRRCSPRSPREEEPHRIDEVLVELLSQYAARFPRVRITIMEEPSRTA